MAVSYSTLLVSDSEIEEIISIFSPYERSCGEAYVTHHYEKDGYQIKLYEGKKGNKLVISGPDPIAFRKEYLPFLNMWVNDEEQIGADEVGVGDLFLPLIIVAVHLDKEDIPKIEEYGIKDSKKLKDDFIMEIGPKLVKEFHYSKLTCHIDKYNELTDKGENVNTIKAKMHNQAISNMVKEYPDCPNIFLDQFVNEDCYYKYLENEEHIATGITFLTKGETYYPSVALASVIARYALLLEKEKLEKKYGVTLPFGAGAASDEFMNEYLTKHGKDALSKLVKTSFANYRKLN